MFFSFVPEISQFLSIDGSIIVIVAIYHQNHLFLIRNNFFQQTMRESIFLLSLPITSVQLIFFVNGFLLHLWTPLIIQCLELYGAEVLPIIGFFTALLCSGSMLRFELDLSPVKSLICCDAVNIVGLLLLLVPTSEGYFPIRPLKRENVFEIENIFSVIGVFICGVSNGMNYKYTSRYMSMMCSNKELEKRFIFSGWAMFYLGALSSLLAGKFYSPPQPTPTQIQLSLQLSGVLAIPLFGILGRSFLLMTIFNDEPPLYSVRQGEDDKAKRTITKYYYHDYVHPQYALFKNYKPQQAPPTPLIVSVMQCYFYLSGILLLTIYSPLIIMQILKDDYTSQRLAMMVMPMVALIANIMNISQGQKILNAQEGIKISVMVQTVLLIMMMLFLQREEEYFIYLFMSALAAYFITHFMGIQIQYVEVLTKTQQSIYAQSLCVLSILVFPVLLYSINIFWILLFFTLVSLIMFSIVTALPKNQKDNNHQGKLEKEIDGDESRPFLQQE